uniref:Laminin subunit beta-1 n=1 Tax=Aceria tosichella TaxID=561515 RepID=A0A6G1SQA5_9ACAR
MPSLTTIRACCFIVLVCLKLLLTAAHSFYDLDSHYLSPNSQTTTRQEIQNRPTQRRQISPPPSPASNLATLNQICSSQRGRNSNLCKPCKCNLIGSESEHCDIYTRRCSCLAGYSGATCNECTQGYYNPPSIRNNTQEEYSNEALNTIHHQQSNPDSTTTAIQGTLCLECDGCYHRWRHNATGLKEQAVHLIERAYKLEKAFNDQLGVLAPASGADHPRLVFGNDNATSLAHLESSISTIGDRVLEDKQKSDQINLLEGELNLTLASLELETSLMTDQLVELEKLDSMLERVDYQVELQSEITRNLSVPIDSLKRELLDINEYIPPIAFEYIGKNRDRTHRALERIIQIDREHSPGINRSINELTVKQEKINFSRRQLDYISTNILTYSIKRNFPNHPTTSATNGTAMVSAEQVLDAEHFHDNILMLETAARVIAESSATQLDNYQSSFDNRTLEMSATRKLIEEAKQTLLLAGQQLTTFETNLTSMNFDMTLKLVNSSGDSDYSQIMEMAYALNRASLDKIDVKWNSAQMDLAELTTKGKNFNQTSSQLTNLITEVNKLLTRNLPDLISFNASLPVDDLMDLESRKKYLIDNLTKLKGDLFHLNGLKQEITGQVKQTKRLNNLNRNDIEITTRWLIDPSGGDSYTEFANKLATANAKQIEPNTTASLVESNLNLKTKTLLRISKTNVDKIRSHQSESFGRKVLFDRHIESKMNELRNVTLTNERLAVEVEEKQAALSDCLEAMTTANVTNTLHANAVRANKLSERKRLTNVITGIRQVSALLYKDLARTNDLAEEFSEHRRVFEDQRNTIDSLHNQMDAINADLEKRYDYYENCPS